MIVKPAPTWSSPAPTWSSPALARRVARRATVFAVAGLLVAALVSAACGPPTAAAVGVVIALDSSGGQVTGFTLRTVEGETRTFVIGELEVDGAAFPAAHLAEHVVTLEPIAVAYRVIDGRNVVHRMVDAPWADPAR